MEELQVIETTSGRQFKPWATKDDVQDPASVTAIASEIASGKQAIAAAINAKGGTASAMESFSELAQDVINLNESFITYGVEVTEKIHWLNFICNSKAPARLPLTAIDDDTVTAISQPNVFQNCTALESVKMTALTTISSGSVFQNCTALESVKMTALTTISSGSVFQNCSALQEVIMPNLTTISGSNVFDGISLQRIELPNLVIISGNNFSSCTLLQEVVFPNLTTISGVYNFNGSDNLRNVIFGTLTSIGNPFYTNKNNLRNITIGQGTNVNLPFASWKAANVIAEGQSGIDELNSNLYNNLLTKLYDHSQDGQTRTLRIGWLAKVTQENIAYANAKGWTLTT